MAKLKGKITLITGASSGIGEACAHAFAGEESNLILIGRRTDRLEKLADQLSQQYPIECLPLTLDIRNKTQINERMSALPPKWQTIDILINNAGLARGLDKIPHADTDDWDEMIDTNIKGLLYITRMVVPGMLERRQGDIVNIGSIAGHEVYAGGNIYCATKHAVDAITKGLRIDLVDTPLRVSTVDPGLVETEFSNVRFRGDSERAKTVYQGYQPLHSADIADAVLYIVTRHPHVQIAEMIVFPTDQASSAIVHKQKHNG
ncbi:MAG: SDR family NAD(P)-dependent oxidoreductase [Caldithrix sp.]|nr:SDR family NAD(P)-dependent oxidoreductase [Caldithrix sp.]